MDITALFDISYGMYILGSKGDDGRDVGCVVNTVFQITSSPVNICVSVNKDNFTNPAILKNGRFTVSILSESVTAETIGVFGFNTSKTKDKFAEVNYFKTDSGLAVIKDEICGYLECRVVNQVDCATHTIIIAEIIDSVKVSSQPPMTYGYYHKVVKGKAPKNAPTYVDESLLKKEVYTCGVCGYEYQGTNGEFDSEGEGYTCPICNAVKGKFSLK